MEIDTPRISNLSTNGIIKTGSSNGSLSVTSDIFAFGITIDGAGGVITTGSKGYTVIPFGCTVVGWDLISDVSGSIEIDIKVGTCASAGGAPDTTSIIGSAGTLPSLVSAINDSDTTLTAWDTAISAGEIVEFYVNSATTVKRVNLIVKATRT